MSGSESQLQVAQRIAQECLLALGVKGEVKEDQRRGLVPALNGQDVFICLPTGFGKSACFQAVPLAFEKIGIENVVVLVVSPLLAVIEHQVTNLNNQIAGYAMHIEDVKDFAKAERTKPRLLYTTPELLVEGADVPQLLRRPYFADNIRLLVFDEVHCVELWGDTFRPAYSQVDTMMSPFPTRASWQ